MIKSLRDISLPITEEEYRNDGCFHYSTLSTFSATGFYGLEHLMDRKETPSLTFGSMVDTWLTDGEAAFYEKYEVMDMPEIADKIKPIVEELYHTCGDVYTDIYMIPDAKIHEVCQTFQWQPSWGASAHSKHIREDGGAAYYDMLLCHDENKQIVSSTDFEDMLGCVNAIHANPLTHELFFGNGDDEIEHLFQLKFRAYATLLPGDCGYYITTSEEAAQSNPNLLPFSNMMDLAYVNHKEKYIIPVDLKTSSHHEGEFHQSFIQWRYLVA